MTNSYEETAEKITKAHLYTYKTQKITTGTIVGKRPYRLKSIVQQERINSILLAVTSVFSVFIVYYEVIHNQNTRYCMEIYDTSTNHLIKAKNRSDFIVNSLRAANMFISVLICMGYLVALIFFQYRICLKKMISRKQAFPHGKHY